MRKKGLPSGRRVHDSLLLYIYFYGGEDYQIHADDSYEPLADLFGLSPQERTMTRHDRNPDDYRTESDWHNRLQFARRDLVNYGYLDNSVKRGIWKLSKSGISYAQRIISNDQDLSNKVRSLVQNPSNISYKIESPDIKSQIAQIIKSEEKELTESKLFDVENIIDSRERTIASVVRRRGQPDFRQNLLTIYEGACAISGYNAVQALEAAHIIPYKGEETNHSANGLLLRSDLHTLFDLRLIAIDTGNMSVLISPELSGTLYSKYIGKKIFIPKNSAERPSIDALNKHRKEANL